MLVALKVNLSSYQSHLSTFTLSQFSTYQTQRSAFTMSTGCSEHSELFLKLVLRSCCHAKSPNCLTSGTLPSKFLLLTDLFQDPLYLRAKCFIGLSRQYGATQGYLHFVMLMQCHLQYMFSALNLQMQCHEECAFTHSSFE